ncbi:hypothetical protein [Vreelandella neptunia]|uniref:Uncharacterized protein n=1 Tax=Vreelandella neptunia TaxID=115551 RepID=A0ABZ0YL81_9GAMM|nr:hypothetical protein [Halomonas neptunia]MDN3562537.1 hypothetical protein [Halomonas neptunia]TDV96926.1 hypothetical protein BDK62_10828 [Halomonas alkaliantarctica]WQH12369.1 hypothetical protein SR894_19800 [Halomonas neptunia]
MHAKFWIIGVVIIVTAVLITKGVDNEGEKGNTMVNVIIGMWAIVLLVLFLIR